MRHDEYYNKNILIDLWLKMGKKGFYPHHGRTYDILNMLKIPKGGS